MHILLAEDNLVNQKVTLAQLRKVGYTAQVVAIGLETLQSVGNGFLRRYFDGLSNAGTGRL